MNVVPRVEKVEKVVGNGGADTKQEFKISKAI